MGLTQEEVERAKPKDRPHVLWDDPWPFGQFGLRVYPSGAKSYIVRYRDRSDTKKFKTVAKHPDSRLKDARVAGFTLLNELRDQQEQKAGTLGEIGEHYIKRLWERAEGAAASRTVETVETDERRIRTRFLDAWADRDALDITTRELKALHTRITEREGHPIEANRVRSVFIAMWNDALEWGLLPTGSPNPAAPITPNPEPERERVLQPAEFKALGRELVRVSRSNPRVGLWLMLLTGQRKNEVMSLEWSNIDFEAMDIRFTVTKTDSTNRVAMSRVVAEILKGHQAKPRPGSSRWVFPSPRTDSYQGNVESTWRGRTADDPNCVRSRAGLNHDDRNERVCLHDFRRTFATYAYEQGASHYVIQECLGHKLQTTLAKHYQRSDEPSSAARDAMNRYADWVIEQAGVTIEQIIEGASNDLR